MANSYGSIPLGPNDGVGSCGESSSNRKLCIALAVVLAGLGFFLNGQSSDGSSPTAAPTVVPVPPKAEHWPELIMKANPSPNPKMGMLPFPLFISSNTTGVESSGWMKSEGVPCDPMLGEEWLYNGERSSDHSVAMYFTPAVGGVPGVLSGIETDYYGYVEEKLIGIFFGEEKTSKDGSYRSISVALRNGDEEDLCDKEASVAPGNPPYVTVSPGMANLPLPVKEDKDELEQSGWQEGSCIPSMGYHWIKFTEPFEGLPYKTGNMVPVVPMYSSVDQTISGIFFSATSKKQHYPVEECGHATPAINPCAFGKVNMWDYSEGLKEVSTGTFYMCSNFCGDCEFTGSDDGWFTTMHWFFRNTLPEACGGYRKTPYCRSGLYPKKVEE